MTMNDMTNNEDFNTTLDILNNFNINDSLVTVTQDIDNNTTTVNYEHHNRENIIDVENTVENEQISLPQSVESTNDTVNENNINENNINEIINNAVENELISAENNDETLIKLNPVTYIADNLTRFSGAKWFDAVRQQKIILAGLGGIGSYVAYLLAKLRPNIIHLYDDDIVEFGNLSGQLYGKNDIDLQKVYAVVKLCENYCDYHQFITHNEKYDENSIAGPIMICGFDNMKARKLFFERWLECIKTISNKNECVFIDGRLNMEEFQVFTITGDDDYAIDKYINNYLFNDNIVIDEICSAKQTAFCANMIGSVITNTFINFVTNLTNPKIKRTLPFKVYYNASIMYFKIDNN